ncbi:MAG: DUF4468 domain-containing protein [Chitinophagaceae bacterium]|nr:DUF4468 domain-containing protein [Chitinophagaceae bacterium]
MKYFLLLFLIFFSKCIIAQNIEISGEPGDTKISIIVQKEGWLQKNLFKLSKEWVYKSFRSGDAVIQTEDEEEGKILCKSFSKKLVYMNTFVKMDGGRFRYFLTIFCKDNKLKAQISDIVHEGGEMSHMRDGSKYSDEFPSTWSSFAKGQTSKQWPKMKAQAFEVFKLVLTSFHDYINSANKDSEF